MGITVDLGCKVVAGVKSVTGDIVDNSDPKNPIILGIDSGDYAEFDVGGTLKARLD